MNRRVAAITVCVLLLVTLLAVAIVAFVGSARQGQRARMTQCVSFPVSSKVYADAERRGVISAAEFRRYRSARPRGCKPPPSRP